MPPSDVTRAETLLSDTLFDPATVEGALLCAVRVTAWGAAAVALTAAVGALVGRRGL